MAPLPSAATIANNVLLIKTIRSFPLGSGTKIGNVTGYSAADIYAQLLISFPDATLTLAEVTTLLANGAKTGIYLRLFCVAGTQYYNLNVAMVQANYQNLVYLQASATWDGVIPGPVNSMGYGGNVTSGTATSLQGTCLLCSGGGPALGFGGIGGGSSLVPTCGSS